MIGKAFLEHHQATDAAVAVLEGMDAFELAVEIDDIFERFRGLVVVGLEQGFHLGVHLLGRAGFSSAHFIGQAFVVAHVEPVFAVVGGPGLENSMEFLDQGLRQFIFGVVDDIVDTAEVVGGFYDVVHVDGLAFALALVVGETNRVGLEDIPCLVVSQFAALDMIGVVGQINLRAVVDAAAHFTLFFFAKSFQKGRGFLFAAAAGGQLSIRGEAPGLAGQEGSINLPGRAPVAYGPFGQVMSIGKFSD